jgi:nitrogen regulatory protein PII
MAHPAFHTGANQMYMIYFILHDSAHLDDVLEAWQDIGVTGVTLMESTGAYRRAQVSNLGARFLFARPRMVDAEQASHTLVTIVPNADVVQQCITAVEGVVGNLDNPNTGVLAAWELDIVRGVPAELRNGEASASEPPIDGDPPAD